MAQMGEWTLITYLQAGAYTAIMAAVIGVPQMLSSFFDLRARRQQEARQEERRQEERRQDEERRRHEAEAAERRHQEVMAALIAVLGNGRTHGNGQSELIRNLQQTIEDLRSENARLRRQNGEGDTDQRE